MTGIEIVSAIVQILVAGITKMGEGIGQGLSSLTSSIFMQTVGEGASATTSLSVFGTLIIVFAAIALAMSLTRWVVNFVTSLGNRNR